MDKKVLFLFFSSIFLISSLSIVGAKNNPIYVNNKTIVFIILDNNTHEKVIPYQDGIIYIKDEYIGQNVTMTINNNTLKIENYKIYINGKNFIPRMHGKYFIKITKRGMMVYNLTNNITPKKFITLKINGTSYKFIVIRTIKELFIGGFNPLTFCYTCETPINNSNTTLLIEDSTRNNVWLPILENISNFVNLEEVETNDIVLKINNATMGSTFLIVEKGQPESDTLTIMTPEVITLTIEGNVVNDVLLSVSDRGTITISLSTITPLSVTLTLQNATIN